MNLKPKINKAKRAIMRESPSILTGIGVTGVFSTTILAIKATPAAESLLYEERVDRYEDYMERKKADPDYLDPDFDGDPTRWHISPLDCVKLTWQCYIPTVISGAITIACIIGANKINLQRNAALMSLYSVTQEALREYQEKVIEVIGKNKEEKVQEELAQDKLEKNPIEEGNIILTHTGEHLFYDEFSGRYFKSDIETVRRCMNDFNWDLLTDMYKPINEFYDYLGIDPIEGGRRIGWDVESGKIEIKFTAKIATNGEPCIVLGYSTYPKPL